MAEKPEPPNKELVPPKGLVVVLVEPNSPPLLVLVPKPEGHEEKGGVTEIKPRDSPTEGSEVEV